MDPAGKLLLNCSIKESSPASVLAGEIPHRASLSTSFSLKILANFIGPLKQSSFGEKQNLSVLFKPSALPDP